MESDEKDLHGLSFADRLEELADLLSRLEKESNEVGSRGLRLIDDSLSGLDEIVEVIGDHSQADLLRHCFAELRGVFVKIEGMLSRAPGDEVRQMAQRVREKDDAGLAALVTELMGGSN